MNNNTEMKTCRAPDCENEFEVTRGPGRKKEYCSAACGERTRFQEGGQVGGKKIATLLRRRRALENKLAEINRQIDKLSPSMEVQA